MGAEALTDLTNDVLENNATTEELAEIAASIEEAEVELRKAQEAERFIAMRLESYRQKLSKKRYELSGTDSEKESNKSDDDTEVERLSAEEDQGSVESIHNSTDNDDLEEGTKSPPILTNEQRLVHDDLEEGTKSPPILTNEQRSDNDDLEEGTKSPPILTNEQRLVQMKKLEDEEAALEKIVNGQYRELQETVKQLQKKIFIQERRQQDILDKTEECKDFLLTSAIVEGQQEAAIVDD
eukprot:CAMPEP_0194227844 /NCGR_PEP_ID=MMETSP0156-20130528/43063_1 /TAXON_ID=33649 /ORGANISM="Thalassionema nitzschioides, Strain L26-B" /LENGTH=238 /DNA_ID=CAMNT_0038960339 /DNA_START=246 /DNA_END=962 /DNA_ORIENTATION=-